MARFRKKPVVIEAVEIDAVLRLVRFEAGRTLLPDWVRQAYSDRKIIVSDHCLAIETLEGTMVGPRGAWLIKGIKGELYSCADSIFKETYEPAD